MARLKAFRLAMRRLGSGQTGEAVRARDVRGRVEFEDHRPYLPGDDLREIDWNLYGRLDCLFVKRFSGESDVTVQVVLDRSGSMGVDASVKDVFARRFSAALAFGLSGNGVRVQVFGMDETLIPVHEIVDGPARLPGLIQALERLGPCAGVARLGSLAELPTVSRGARLVVICSDFFGEESVVPQVVRSGAARGQIELVGVWAGTDRQPGEEERQTLVGIEGEGRRHVVVDAGLRQRYREVFEAWRTDLAAQARSHGMGFTETPAEAAFDRVARNLFQTGRTGA